MPDREKVIKGLEICSGRGSCKDCGYHLSGGYSTMDCRKPLLRDALALLKEQEAIEPDVDSEGTCTCGNCGENVGYYPAGSKVPEKLCKYCSECGKAVKWE